MANSTVNKVILGNETLIDLTPVTVTADKLASGYTALDASGALVTGTLDSVTGSVYQDADGYVVLNEGESTAPQGNISITANGTYDVSDYAGVTVDVPIGMEESDLRGFIGRLYTFKDIDWPSGTTIIGKYAFASCTYFNPASLPSELTNIGNYAFSECTSLRISSIPPNVTSIGNYAFYRCSNITVAALPNIAIIGSHTFDGCSKLALTALPSSVTQIGDYAFQGCNSITISSIPSGITNIPLYSFACCYNITITSLPSSMTTIGNYAFFQCESITSISCDGQITSLGYYAFYGSSSHPMKLVSASFPNMTLSTFYQVFGSNTVSEACCMLEFADIGSVNQITNGAFANCSSLTTLVLRRTAGISVLNSVNAFNNTPLGTGGSGGTVYVPSALISSYQTATNWKTLYDAGTVTFAAIEGSDYELE